MAQLLQPNILLSCIGEHSRGHDTFLSEHALWLIVSGSMEVLTNSQVDIYGKGTLFLSRKNQLIKAVKKPDGDKPFMGISIILDQATLNEYSLAHQVKPSGPYRGEPNVFLSSDSFLKGYFDSLIPYFDQPEALTDTLAKVKTTEAISLLLRHPPLKDFLFDFNQVIRSDLQVFMQEHFIYNVPLGQFAKLTGRSLSTFKRDFTKTFADSPEKWLKRQRLERAHYLLTQEHRSPTDVYVEVGFENLSHFSDSFKRQFGYNPRQAIHQHQASNTAIK